MNLLAIRIIMIPSHHVQLCYFALSKRTNIKYKYDMIVYIKIIEFRFSIYPYFYYCAVFNIQYRINITILFTLVCFSNKCVRYALYSSNTIERNNFHV